MLQWTQAGPGARLMMLVYHDDAKREYAYGPAGGLPESHIGTFPEAAYGSGEKGRLGCDQHGEGLEARFLIRQVSGGICQTKGSL
jgi:hypothetical protein